MGVTRLVRVDTNEHSLELLPYALGTLDNADVVVLDTIFDDTTLAPGSGEEYHNRYVLPAVTAAASEGRLTLSGAHGYMAFRAEALASILPLVLNILEAAETDASARHLPVPVWSADTLLPLVALRLGLSVAVHPRPATAPRRNAASKSAHQLRDLLTLLSFTDLLSPRPQIPLPSIPDA